MEEKEAIETELSQIWENFSKSRKINQKIQRETRQVGNYLNVKNKNNAKKKQQINEKKRRNVMEKYQNLGYCAALRCDPLSCAACCFNVSLGFFL